MFNQAQDQKMVTFERNNPHGQQIPLCTLAIPQSLYKAHWEPVTTGFYLKYKFKTFIITLQHKKKVTTVIF